jgi:hypothetical protein
MKSTLEAIYQVLEDIAQPGKPSGDILYQIVTDTIHHHYQVIASGWRGMEYVHTVVVHIEIRDNVVWIHADNTDYDIAEALVSLGVSRNQIVLGFQAPSVRKHTGFATGEVVG